MYEPDSQIEMLERRAWQLVDLYGASHNSIVSDADLLILILKDEWQEAKRYTEENYGYCEQHDDDHGNCGMALMEVPD